MLFFFFNDTATTEIYPLSLHDALPILRGARAGRFSGPHPPAERRVLPRADGNLHPAVCRGPSGAIARRCRHGLPERHVRRRGEPRRVGPEGARTTDQRFGVAGSSTNGMTVAASAGALNMV